MLPIYVDFDDVVCDTTRSFIDILKREKEDFQVKFDQISSFNLKESLNISQGELNNLFDIANQRDEILKLKPIDGAIEVLKKWEQIGCEINIVTGRVASIYKTSIDWLLKHDVPFHAFTMVDKYSRSNNTETNVAISLDTLSKIKFSFAIEDSPAMAVHLSKVMRTPVALLDCPWNRTENFNTNVKRCFSWNEIDAEFVKPALN